MLVHAAEWVLPVSAPPIRDGALAVEGSKIAWVGPRRDLPSRFLQAPLRVHPRSVILPGWVNAHAHLNLTAALGLVPGTADTLAARLAASAEWHDGDALPRTALLCHDGMGMSGSSRAIVADAGRLGHPTLFTGHLPASSPGERMVAQRRASWIRLPTHPTLAENLALVASSGATAVIGHSCDTSVLRRMQPHLPRLDASLATGDRVVL